MTREEWIRQEIERYRRRIETYLAVIAEWETELGMPHQRHEPQNGGPAPDGGAKRTPAGDDPIASIPGMIFFGKSQPEASRMLLERVSYPLTTGQVLSGIEKGGVKVGGKTESAKKVNLYTILNRSPEFARVARDTWGLVGWPGVAKKAVDEGDGRKSDEPAE
jgi:hypothetical protein